MYLNPKSGIYFNLVQNQEFILLKSKISTLFYLNPKSGLYFTEIQNQNQFHVAGGCGLYILQTVITIQTNYYVKQTALPHKLSMIYVSIIIL